MSKLNVLVSCPSICVDSIYLPYIYGLLKSTCDKDSNLKHQVNWMFPICETGSVAELLKDIAVEAIDVLALSCYTWNWELQCQIAAAVKSLSPQTLVVAGGPHPDGKSPDFFDRHSDIDCLVVGEGEYAFRTILQRRIANLSLRDVPGVMLPNQERFIPGERVDLTQELVSPWVAESDFYQDFIKHYKRMNPHILISAILETTRGCPYFCTFCDWGSLTMSKVGQLPVERVHSDINWLMSNAVEFLFIADANWGILDRDVEITEYLSAQASLMQRLRFLYFSPTKSRGKNLTLISEIFRKYRIGFTTTVSLQHTDPTVLENMKRKNLPGKDLKGLLEYYRNKEIPICVQLIVGGPGDSPEKWFNCLVDIIEYRLPFSIAVYNFMILPNAPAADRDYFDRFFIQTHTSTANTTGVRQKVSSSSAANNMYIVESYSYSKEDWVCMWSTYTAINFLYLFGSLKIVADALDVCFGISYRVFFKDLLVFMRRSAGPLGQIYKGIERQKREFLANTNLPLDEIFFQELGEEFSTYLHPDEWAFYQLCVNKEDIFRELAQYFHSMDYIRSDIMSDLLTYQKNFIVGPDYKCMEGRRFTARLDWLRETKEGAGDWFKMVQRFDSQTDLCVDITQKCFGLYNIEPCRWKGSLESSDVKMWLDQIPLMSFVRGNSCLFSQYQTRGSSKQAVGLNSAP